MYRLILSQIPRIMWGVGYTARATMLQSPRKLIIIGFILVASGFVLPLLMVIGVIQPSFLISFLSHGASVTGLFLGFWGTMMIIRIRRD